MLSNLAVCYSHIGKYDKAISLYIQILKKKNDFRGVKELIENVRLYRSLT